MAAQEPQRVSAADFIRGFANWRMQSARKPVVVTHHGKDAHVLISLDDYRRLDGDTASEISAKANALQGSLAGLVDSIHDAVLVIDRQARIAAANPAACDLLCSSAAGLTGTGLAAALPGLDGSLLSHRLSRLLDHRERFSGDIPGILRPRQWLRVDLVPVPLGGAIILRDVSDVMEDCAAGDARNALVAAVDVHGGIGHARISVRETVTAANDALTAMIGVDATAIRRVRFSALLAIGQRQAFVEALEEVFRTGDPVRLGSGIVTREGAILPVTLAIVEMRGAYASDGAIILVTPAAA
ncbi:MAG TPA: type II toxin-antitoxin system Phd/YefM family antitoxin [Sphingopyxis sp.]|uniref:type II toxin-antitoxin system Phd/YefM family antitoxin n=1 Tax=Sphingopyxis sp. TaxID=1908224 RepID=UPI002C507FC9|nr:type II toxin-antitoxin system Phd/YefM family antitoxin [Sphingopyxis sp.]HWW55816.1 type II toxin-antitoxin system Phd/YefM family antitoxin [Sphingopyxis sp.]